MGDSKSTVEAEGLPGLQRHTRCRRSQPTHQQAPPELEQMGPWRRATSLSPAPDLAEPVYKEKDIIKMFITNTRDYFAMVVWKQVTHV
jgi:hypothetical protein